MNRERPAGASRLVLLGLAAWVAAATLAPSPAWAERRVEVYKAQHRTAQELLPLAQTALGGRGNAVVDSGTNSLVLMGDPGAVADALDLLRSQDRSLRTVMLRYESRRNSELEAVGVRIAWSAGAGPVRVGNVIFPGGRTGAVIAPIARDSRREGRFEGRLRILEGEAGRIATGTTVPVTVRQGWWTSTHFATGESGFEARPRILGDGRVRIEIQPFEGSVDGSGTVRFTEAATTVVAAPGETVAIGGLARSGSGRDRDAFGGTLSARGSSDQVLLLTVEVE